MAINSISVSLKLAKSPVFLAKLFTLSIDNWVGVFNFIKWDNWSSFERAWISFTSSKADWWEIN